MSTVQNRTKLRARLVNARATWESAGINSYTYESQTSCFCIGVGFVRMTVVNGVVTSSEPVGDEEIFVRSQTIDDHFDVLADSLDGVSASITVTFDKSLGYPVDYYIDVSQGIADEERGVTNRNLVR